MCWRGQPLYLFQAIAGPMVDFDLRTFYLRDLYRINGDRPRCRAWSAI